MPEKDFLADLAGDGNSRATPQFVLNVCGASILERIVLLIVLQAGLADGDCRRIASRTLRHEFTAGVAEHCHRDEWHSE